ncbi:flagellar protein FlaF [Methanoregula sp.]|jgi:archaeal flagellar protein FlaF|uniref:flagellar protein FlaF n=1 Tax=Methanoregula sp. TaxID=2052170 RepID=UPI003C23BA5A
MAVAELIGAAIGVLLLVTVAYLLVGGTLSTAETVVTAQKDITLLHEARLRTSISVTDKEIDNNNLNISITNTGDEIVTDLPHMDVFSFDATNGYEHYTYSTNSGDPNTWQIVRFENDKIHAKELDPGVKMWIQVNLPVGVTPSTVQVTTSNGVSAISQL